MKERIREKVLEKLEQNAKIDLHTLSLMLGFSEEEIANEIAEMEIGRASCRERVS